MGNIKYNNMKYYGYEESKKIKGLLYYVYVIVAITPYILLLVDGDTATYTGAISISGLLAYMFYKILENRIFTGEKEGYYPINLLVRLPIIKTVSIFIRACYIFSPVSIIYFLLLIKNTNEPYARQEINTFLTVLITTFIILNILAYIYFKLIYYSDKRISAKDYTDKFIKIKKLYPNSSYYTIDKFIRENIDDILRYEKHGLTLEELLTGNTTANAYNSNTVNIELEEKYTEGKHINEEDLTTHEKIVINPGVKRRKRG